jgi:hypothetical protein
MANTSMLQQQGAFRLDFPVPPNAEYTITRVVDPYGVATTTHFSLYRRPLPAANLSFDTDLMWDTRETITPFLTTNTAAQNIAALHANLNDQALNATLRHAQATSPPTQAQLDAISSFQQSLYTAQIQDTVAGDLTNLGATGGPILYSSSPFYVGFNDAFGNDPTGRPFSNQVFTNYASWANLTPVPSNNPTTLQQLSIARGENIFNTRTFTIKDVAGLNTAQNPSFQGTCTTCHGIPNSGNRPVSGALGTGVSNFLFSEQPKYQLTNNSTGVSVQVTDPGLAVITGKWADIGRFKVPILRGLAARAPYMHDGEFHSLNGVTLFYNARFQIGLTPAEQVDLQNFLATL